MNFFVMHVYKKCFKIFQSPQGLKSNICTHLYCTFELIFCSTLVWTILIGKGFLGPVLAETLNIYWIFEYCRPSFASKWVLLVWVMDNFSLTPVSLYATCSLLSKAFHCFHLIVAYTHFTVSWKYFKYCIVYWKHIVVWLALTSFFIVKNLYFMCKNNLRC